MNYRKRFLTSLVTLAAIVPTAFSEPAISRPEQVVRVELRTGGSIEGKLLDADEHAFVILRDQIPYGFSWRELEPPSAIHVRKAVIARERENSRLGAQDHFELGLFALELGRNDLASAEFRVAVQRQTSYQPKVREAFDRFRKKKDIAKAAGFEEIEASKIEPAQLDQPTTSVPPVDDWVPLPNANIRSDIGAVYRKFGQKVQQTLGPGIEFLESEHFLIWTDWEKNHREKLPDLAEQMYSAVSAQLGVPANQQIFLDNCPMFVWKSRNRFRNFARYFDGYDGDNAVGYTRSIAANGHVHVVLLRHGSSEIDHDLFAATLIHEGTHAFLHRLHSTELIPAWVNEGFAELIVERVLGERSYTAEKAALLARQFKKRDCKIISLLERSGPIEVEQYPLAHSVVAYLETRDALRFREFIRRLKSGDGISTALSQVYSGMTLADLERDWLASMDEKQAFPQGSSP